MEQTLYVSPLLSKQDLDQYLKMLDKARLNTTIMEPEDKAKHIELLNSMAVQAMAKTDFER